MPPIKLTEKQINVKALGYAHSLIKQKLFNIPNNNIMHAIGEQKYLPK